MFDAVDGDSEVYHLVSVYMIDVLEHLDKKSQDIAAIAELSFFLFNAFFPSLSSCQSHL